VADASVATSTGDDVADLGPRVRGVVEEYNRATPKALPKPRKFTLDRGSAMIAIDQRAVEPHWQSAKLRKGVRPRRGKLLC
jgi:hypothetical protein